MIFIPAAPHCQNEQLLHVLGSLIEGIFDDVNSVLNADHVKERRK
jgi:hypothetical protein